MPSPAPLTHQLALFTSTLSPSSIPPSLNTHLKVLILDYLSCALYGATHTPSALPFLTAIISLNSGASGTSTVFTRGSSFLPQYAALLNGAYAHSLDFDDTHLAAVVHPGVTVITAALTSAEGMGVRGEEILTAIAAGCEVVCRLGVAVNSSGFAKGFHNTATCGLFGAIAAICSLKGLDAAIIEAAFGIAISKAAGSMQFLQNGAWNKRLHPGFAAHDAFLCVAFAEAGVVAATEAIEGEHGLLRLFGSVDVVGDAARSIGEGLGEVWRCEETAIKPYPACRLTHGAIDLASSLRLTSPSTSLKALHLHLSPLAFKITGIPNPTKRHPSNAVDAQFSSYYQLAITWLDGPPFSPAIYERLEDSDVSSLLSKITIEENQGLSDLQATLTVQYEDGSSESRTCEAPLGEAGNPLSSEDILRKYRSLADPVLGRERAKKLRELVMEFEVCEISDLMGLVGASAAA